jgi:hypothetical protein
MAFSCRSSLLRGPSVRQNVLPLSAPEVPLSAERAAERGAERAAERVSERAAERVLDRAALATTATLLAAWVHLALDTSVRNVFGSDPGEHFLAAFALASVVGVVAGGVAFATVTIPALVGRALAVATKGRSRARGWSFVGAAATSCLYGALAALAIARPAFSMFQGRIASKGVLARFGPYVVLAGAALAAVVAHRLVVASMRRAERHRPSAAIGVALLFAGVGVALSLIDLHLFVALYARLHAVAEVASFVAFACAFGVVLVTARAAVRATRLRAAARAVPCVAAVWTVAFVASPALREWHIESLKHVGRDPVLVGRNVQRLRSAQDIASGSRGASASAEATLAKVMEEYDVADGSLHPMWDVGEEENEAERRAAMALRAGCEGCNVIVYFVDTLRADMARDRVTMPNVVAFGESSLAFDNAYSTGSDTVRGLGGIVRGRYDQRSDCTEGLLEEVRRSGAATKLFISESMFQFLQAELPEFHIDDVTRIRDFPETANVWGYGADEPTAHTITTEALTWIRAQAKAQAESATRRAAASDPPLEVGDEGTHTDASPKPFFAWLYNSDLHNWRELRKDHIDATAQRFDVPEDRPPWNWQYRVVARSIDAEFGRLLDGLRDAGIEDRTVVLFVADHGEGLGYQGFWVHGVFLWESLVRVPLLLRAPGVPKRRVVEPVSLVDVAPTLGRFLRPTLGLDGYHGMDLLGFATARPPTRKLPLLVSAVSERKMAQLGVVRDGRKLVLPLDWAEPQLYDVTREEPDEEDIAELEPRRTLELLNSLLRSPLVPRPSGEAEVARTSN